MRSEQRPISFIYHYLIDAPSLGHVRVGLKCLCGNELCLISGGRSLGSQWGEGDLGEQGFCYYVTEFICLAWLLTALTCIAYISHVSHLHSWSREADSSHFGRLKGPFLSVMWEVSHILTKLTPASAARCDVLLISSDRLGQWLVWFYGLRS